MKKIDFIENIKTIEDLNKAQLPDGFYRAYRKSIESENELLDFADISISQVDGIFEACKRFGITKFSISSGWSDTTAVFCRFVELGCRIIGATKANKPYIDIQTQKYDTDPALVLEIEDSERAACLNVQTKTKSDVAQEGMKYYVTFKVDARYVAEVRAENIEDAIRKATECFQEADFGAAEDVDGEEIIVEDENGNYVWEKE